MKIYNKLLVNHIVIFPTATRNQTYYTTCVLMKSRTQLAGSLSWHFASAFHLVVTGVTGQQVEKKCDQYPESWRYVTQSVVSRPKWAMNYFARNLRDIFPRTCPNDMRKVTRSRSLNSHPSSPCEAVLTNK